jgi:hypothetical protein
LMESWETNSWLPDVNVWLSLCPDSHEHHQAAVKWFDPSACTEKCGRMKGYGSPTNRSG